MLNLTGVSTVRQNASHGPTYHVRSSSPRRHLKENNGRLTLFERLSLVIKTSHTYLPVLSGSFLIIRQRFAVHSRTGMWFSKLCRAFLNLKLLLVLGYDALRVPSYPHEINAPRYSVEGKGTA